jgi:hypothetical protein
VTLEVVQGVPNLRGASMAPIVGDAIGRANQREDFRVVQFCLLATHIHAICEADGPAALARGMQGLNCTLAKAINRRLGRAGQVIACRYDLHVLRTKTEVRNAVRYVLRNAERHGVHDAWPEWADTPRTDPLSTAVWFPYLAERELLVAPNQIPASAVRPAQCYLMKLAFQGAPLSFKEAMRGKANAPQRKTTTRAHPATGRAMLRRGGTPPNRDPVPDSGRQRTATQRTGERSSPKTL